MQPRGLEYRNKIDFLTIVNWLLNGNKNVDALCLRKSPIFFQLFWNLFAWRMDYALTTTETGWRVKLYHVLY